MIRAREDNTMPDLPDDIMLPLPDDGGLRLEVAFVLGWDREDSDNPTESGWTCEAYLDSGFLSVPDRSDPHGVRIGWLELNADEVEKLLGASEIKRMERSAAEAAMEDWE